MSSGGLQLLLDIFNSAILEPKEQESWTVVSVKNTSASYNVYKQLWISRFFSSLSAVVVGLSRVSAEAHLSVRGGSSRSGPGLS